jgi:hypothetical protein
MADDGKLPYGLMYETGWDACCKCGCRRPIKEMGAETYKSTDGKTEVTEYTCNDKRVCKRMQGVHNAQEGQGQV